MPNQPQSEIDRLISVLDLSAFLDLLIQQEEQLREQLIKTRQLRQQVEQMVPNNPIRDFINDELELPEE